MNNQMKSIALSAALAVFTLPAIAQSSSPSTPASTPTTPSSSPSTPASTPTTPSSSPSAPAATTPPTPSKATAPTVRQRDENQQDRHKDPGDRECRAPLFVRQDTPSERDPLRLAGSPDADLRLGHLRDITPGKELLPPSDVGTRRRSGEPSPRRERHRGGHPTLDVDERAMRLWRR